MGLGRDIELYMMSEGRRIGLGKLGKDSVRQDGTHDERRRKEEEDKDWESVGEFGKRRKK